MHDSYRRALAPKRVAQAHALDAMAAELWDDVEEDEAEPSPLTLTHVTQGLDAVAEVEHARSTGAPFAVAFIDIRMPPGIDGRETARRIRAIDPDIALVIVTGYSDFSPIEIAKVAGPA